MDSHPEPIVDNVFRVLGPHSGEEGDKVNTRTPTPISPLQMVEGLDAFFGNGNYSSMLQIIPRTVFAVTVQFVT